MRQKFAVSIHAPARGATLFATSMAIRQLVSIHAPARGATGVFWMVTCPSLCFNSRAREGRDYGEKNSLFPFMGFQFTRPRGARRTLSACPAAARRFNSRAREGRDRLARVVNSTIRTFQFTRPRGARLVRRLRAEAGDVVSIHAPARGATGISSFIFHARKVSIHAPARGATSKHKHHHPKHYQFQFTRPRGARRIPRKYLIYIKWFQFTRPRGARLPLTTRQKIKLSFNSRAREGRDGWDGRAPRLHPRFNSRAREGRDTHAPPVPRENRVSIHAPARGAT